MAQNLHLIKTARTTSLQQNIQNFLSDLSDNYKNRVQERCLQEIQALNNIKPNSRKTYIMRYRKAVSEVFGKDHPALQFLTASGLSSAIRSEHKIRQEQKMQAQEEKEDQIETAKKLIAMISPNITVDDNNASKALKKLASLINNNELVKKPPTREQIIELFVEKVLDAQSISEIKVLWKKEYSSLIKKRLTDNTLKTYISSYRTELRKHFGHDHKSLEIVKLPDKIMERINDKYRLEIIKQHKNLIHIPLWKQIIETATRSLNIKLKFRNHYSTQDLMTMAAALLVLTGRRPYEIICSGTFSAAPLPEAVNKAKSKWSVMFEGQTKTRGAEGTRYNTSYEIPVLAPAPLILEAINRIRTTHKGKKFQKLSNAEFRTLTYSRGQDTRLNLYDAVLALFKPLWPFNTDLTPKSLRPLYAEIAYKFFSSPSVTKNSFFARVLGHQANDLETSLSYMDYYLDAESDAAQNTLNHSKSRIKKVFEEKALLSRVK